MSDPNETCPNCDSGLVNGAEFCHNCGQKVIEKDVRMKSFLEQFMGDYFTFDSKFFNSVIPLLFKPGFLTNEYFEGRRVRYIAPLRLYIFISIVFFLLLGFSAESSDSEAIDKLFNVYFPRLFFILLPFFAAILYLLHLRSQSNFVKHFLFSVHFHAFFFLSSIVYLLISELLESFHLIAINQILAAIFGVLSLVYLFVAIRKVFRESIGRTILKYLALLILYGGILTIVSLTTLLLISEA